MSFLYLSSDIFIEYKHPDLVFTGSNAKMELDLYVPTKSLALEYNGSQHYHTNTVYNGGGLDMQQQRDELKHQACKNAGITLIHILFFGCDGVENVVVFFLIVGTYSVLVGLGQGKPSGHHTQALSNIA